MKTFLIPLIAVLALFGCGGHGGHGGHDGHDASVHDAGEHPEEAATGAAVAEQELLPHPFTAEEIRGEFRPGLIIELQSAMPQGEARMRWTIVAADAETVQIDYQPIDGEGNPIAPSQVNPATWVELRDHASFPAATATREWVSRETALGQLDGWLYTVPDAPSGTVTTYFFASSLPGAPVQMRTEKDGQLVMEMQQVSRRHTEG